MRYYSEREFVKQVEHPEQYKLPANFDSWMDYWLFKTGSCSKYICKATDCDREGLVGILVQKTMGRDSKIYVIPVCKCCSNRHDLFSVITEFVPIPEDDW